MQIELKACPFCPKSAVGLFNAQELDDPKCEGYAACCDMQSGGCGASSGYRETVAEAIAAWNTRAEGDAWTPISMDTPTDAPLDVPLLLAWKDWDGTLVMEVGLAGSTRGRWRHGQATHWRPLVDFPAALKTSTGEGN